jgi:hypothetical protein
MKDLNKIIKEVKEVGSVFYRGIGSFRETEWDFIFRGLYKVENNYDNLILFATPNLCDEIKIMLDFMNAGYKEKSLVPIAFEDEAVALVPRFDFQRGGKDIIVIERTDIGKTSLLVNAHNKIDIGKSILIIDN